MATAIVINSEIICGEVWYVDEIKELLGSFTTAITHKMDDHDLLIELRALSQYTLSKVDTLVAEIPKRYVTADQFQPVRNLVYGLTAVILTGVIGALVSLVIRK